MKKVFCVIAAAAVAAFLILSPAFISKGLGKSIFEVMEEEKTRRYEGNIELWHVVSFKTSAKSGYSFLCERMKTLSKTLPYVYINVSGMTAEEAEQRFLKGERPDVVSYPAGFKLNGDGRERRNVDDAHIPVAGHVGSKAQKGFIVCGAGWARISVYGGQLCSSYKRRAFYFCGRFNLPRSAYGKKRLSFSV